MSKQNDVYFNMVTRWRSNLMRFIPPFFNWWGFVIACIIFGLTFSGNQKAFSPAGYYASSPVFLLAKLCNLFFIIIAVQFCIYLIKNYRQGNLVVRRFCFYFSLIFTVMLLFWILTYPGITSTDEANVLYAARHLNIHMSWYHVLTNFCYIFALSIYPSWGAITLLEVFFVCIVSAYIMAHASMYFGSKKVWLLFIFLLSPQVLADSLTPHRISFFASAELLLIFLVWRYSYSKEAQQKSELFIVGLLTGIVATWRSEAIIYLIAVPLCIWFFDSRQHVRLGCSAKVAVIAFAVFLPITVIQNLNAGLVRQYQVTGLIAPLGSVLRGGNYNSNNKGYVKQVVDKAISYNQLVSGKDANTVYWSRNDRSISASDLTSLQKQTIRLILSNPSPYLKGTVKNYISSGLAPVRMPSELVPLIDSRFSEGLIASHPFSVSIRDECIRVLKGVDLSGKKVTWVYRVFYADPIIGILLLLITVILFLKRKVISVLFLAVVAKNGIVVLTIPMPSVYYFYPLALVGGLLIILTVFQYEENWKEYFEKIHPPKVT